MNNYDKLWNFTTFKIYQIDNVGNFKVGCIYYSFDSLLYKDFLEKRNDKYFYANRYLTYVWKNNSNDYSRIQCELSKKLGYNAIRDFNWERNQAMNEIPANLLYNPAELEKWLDDLVKDLDLQKEQLDEIHR